MSRNTKDKILTYITYISASIAVIILLAILTFIFGRGFGMITPQFIFGDYHQTPYYVNVDKPNKTFTRPGNLSEDIYFSEKYGIGLSDGYNLKLDKAIEISYIDSDSPLLHATRYADRSTPTNEVVNLGEDFEITGIYLIFSDETKNWTVTPIDAKDAIRYIETMDIQLRMAVTTPGGGIWGSILTTLIMMGITVVIVIPLGVGIALFLTEYAHKNKIISVLRTMIDMLTGVPSIVFGFFGVFIFLILLKTGGAVIYGGAIILAAILLPVVIRSTEESLISVPGHWRHASYALGASKLQTIKKVIIPSALPGILTATILSIGRVIGESAALILVSGTIVVDQPTLNGPGTTLAVLIWKEMSGENPNIQLVSGISVIIIMIVLLLNILLKVTTRKLNKKLG